MQRCINIFFFQFGIAAVLAVRPDSRPDDGVDAFASMVRAQALPPHSDWFQAAVAGSSLFEAGESSDTAVSEPLWLRRYALFWACAIALYFAALGITMVIFFRISNEDAGVADTQTDLDEEAGDKTGTSSAGTGSSCLGSKAQKDKSKPKKKNVSFPDEVGDSYVGSRLRFSNRNMEAQWLHEVSKPATLRSGAATLAVLSAALIAYHIARLMQAVFVPCLMDNNLINWAAHGARYAALLACFAASVQCWQRPSDVLYWAVVLFYFFYTVATSLPPFEWSCLVLSEDAFCRKESMQFLRNAVIHCDCSLQGPTASLMIITWILALPWLLPRFEYMHLVWVWLLVVYLGWTLSFRMIVEADTKPTYDLYKDVSVRFLAMVVTVVAATVKKYYLEKAQRAKFLDDMEEATTSKRIFRILMYMMPDHVILPMLRDPSKTIAEDIGRVSILFIVIADFEKFATTKTPKELLKFLNDQFTSMDQICARNGVTKIETVCEEYVAAVGVLPSEQEETAASGHGLQLERMFRAAGAILEKQTDEVRFKMGVETGPIVAGVIGTKLPRYRLFGNTINTAARMMQKGVEGKLQFGEETKKELQAPDLLKKVERRGLVTMKGKGDVMAYTFGVEEVASPAYEDLDEPVRARRRRGLAQRICAERGFRAKEKEGERTPGGSPSPEKASSPSLALVEEEREVNERFESALQSIDEEEQAAAWRGLPEKMEAEWFKWHHTTSFCDSIASRYGEMVILNILLLALEIGYMFWVEAWEYTNDVYHTPELRLPVFTFCRLGALLIRMLWWYVGVASSWIESHPAEAQTLLIISSTCILALFWLSYDALVFSDTEKYQRDMREKELVAPGDQVFVIFLTLIILFEIGKHDYLFRQSVLFVIAIFATTMIGPVRRAILKNSEATPLSIWPSIYTLQGKCLLIANVVMNAVFCWESERISRMRFRTRYQVEKAKVRTELILEKLMPVLVVRELAELPPGVSELPSHKYRHVTLAQSDLCGFTQLSASRTPQEVVSFMGELFGAFDKLTDKYGVYKVETVGDAYIAGMGERPLTQENSPVKVVLFGLDMVRAVHAWSANRGFNVRCRCGIHYGECIGGIVGDNMQRYHLFGDLLRVVEIMESTAPEARVQVSDACRVEVERQLRDGVSGLDENVFFETRGVTELKTSKGEVHTFDEVGGKAPSVVDSNMPLHCPPTYPQEEEGEGADPLMES